MSAQTVIDSLEFAGAAKELRGKIPVAEFVRLRDCLSDTSGDVEFIVRGGRNKERRPILMLEIGSDLRLQCQRCLGTVHHRLDVRSMLLLVRPGEDLSENAEDPEAPDCIEADQQLDVGQLVEDEILLSLPFAPRHADDGCQSALGGSGGETRRPSSFAKLAELKRMKSKE
jgi:DUF177 domain-containing protein